MIKQICILLALLIWSGIARSQDNVTKSPELGKLDVKKYKHLLKDIKLYSPKDKFQPSDLSKKLNSGNKMSWTNKQNLKPIESDSIFSDKKVQQKFNRNDIVYHSTMPMVEGISKMKMSVHNPQDSTVNYSGLTKKIIVIPMTRE
ncbi:MAG: hypothetical protein JXQ96_05400 [Cyclobacteriaceae bacterium]